MQVGWVTGLWRCVSVTLMTLETLLQKGAALHTSWLHSQRLLSAGRPQRGAPALAECGIQAFSSSRERLVLGPEGMGAGVSLHATPETLSLSVWRMDLVCCCVLFSGVDGARRSSVVLWVGSTAVSVRGSERLCVRLSADIRTPPRTDGWELSRAAQAPSSNPWESPRVHT